ncbi:MAG: hypothetical protein AB1765_03200 [Candidatus Hydrogenedentota bacterium]
MNKGSDFKHEYIIPYEHLEFVVKNTTPYQRLKKLEETWLLWRAIRRTLPRRVIRLQDALLSNQGIS